MTNKEIIAKGITANHSGKMLGMSSYSTACTMCKACIKAHNTDNDLSVCKHCYSFRMLKRYKALREKLERNYEFITQTEIQLADVPFINTAIFRFEAFGDLANAVQFRNYVLIALANENTTFTLWTKRPYVIENAFSSYDIPKPKNLIIVYSEPIINKAWTEPDYTSIRKIYPFIDKVFTVHNGDTDININCGARKCAECRLCYSHNDVHIINELLK